MKKLLVVLLTLLMVFTLVGCDSKEETPEVKEPVIQEEVIEPIKEEEPEIVGGYVDAEDGTITPELNGIFASAMQGLLGASYEPVKLVATQVVAGTNYKFLAEGTKTTNLITKGTYYIYINEDLQGNISLLDIEVIEEKQEEVKTQDVTNMSFWVVFYDQYGNELQREALKYGTVPSFKGTYPEGFDNWDKSLKAITGNTYIHAICHEVHHHSSEPTPVPDPDPEYVQVECLTSTSGTIPSYIDTGVKLNDFSSNIEFIFDARLSVPLGNFKSRLFGALSESGEWLGIDFQANSSSELGLFVSTTSQKSIEMDIDFDVTSLNSYDVCFPSTSGENVIVKVNGKQYAGNNDTCGGINGDQEVSLFIVSKRDGDISNSGSVSIHNMMIKTDGTLIRDFIPVKTIKEIDKSRNAKDSNENIPVGTLCMYEKVEDKYYPNFGNEPFTEDDPACLAKGTLITMADGSRKPIEELKHGDAIKVFDHETGELSNSKIMDYWHYDEPRLGLITLHFTDNINVNIVVEHSFYCMEENTYVVLNSDNIDEYIGKQFYNADNDSWETLLDATYSNEKVDTYYLATENHYNCVAEGMLTVEDGVYYVICNTFDYDDNMKINNQKKNDDIKQHGLFTHEDFEYLTKEEFDSHKLAYLKVALGKGLITEADLKLLEDVWTSEKEILANAN